MVELGQLEKQSKEFEKRGVRLVVSSIEGPAEAQQTQAEFPHLVVLNDSGAQFGERSRSHSCAVIANRRRYIRSHHNLGRLSRAGVRWLFRPNRHIERISVPDLLAAIDQHSVK